VRGLFFYDAEASIRGSSRRPTDEEEKEEEEEVYRGGDDGDGGANPGTTSDLPCTRTTK
jgi:hypothetical protein